MQPNYRVSIGLVRAIRAHGQSSRAVNMVAHGIYNHNYDVIIKNCPVYSEASRGINNDVNNDVIIICTRTHGIAPVTSNTRPVYAAVIWPTNA